ncbi:DUF2791 family P-loop domain-containing protein [Bradyrhizobium sp. 168]|nr:DUF2791 family P-loop domain-containing protein [Bradyrhizobium sp. 168]
MPSWDIDRLSVGYDETKRLTELSLKALDLPGQLTPLFVRGEWGTGKTHLLSFVQAAASRASVANARIDLNARNAALNYPQRFLRCVSESIQANGSTGIKSFLVGALEEKATRSIIKRFSRSTLAGDFGAALESICTQFESGTAFELGDHAVWSMLYGVDLSWSDDQMKRERAISRIGALAQLCRAIGLKGLVLVMDEAETIDQLWNVRSRVSGYYVLERMFQSDALWCVLATTMRFDRTIERDLESGILSLELGHTEALDFLRRWRNNRYQRFEPPVIDGRGAKKLAGSIAQIYELAYGRMGNVDDILTKCVLDWSKNPSRNPRRLIRLIVHALDVSRKLATNR